MSECDRKFRDIPILYLLETEGVREFRKRLGEVRREILDRDKPHARAAREVVDEKKPEGSSEARSLRTLLQQPNIEAFLAEWNRLNELQPRISQLDEDLYVESHRYVVGHPDEATLQRAAFTLRQKGLEGSAKFLAMELGVSRPALYRRFGTKKIQTALKWWRNDTKSIHQVRKA